MREIALPAAALITSIGFYQAYYHASYTWAVVDFVVALWCVGYYLWPMED